MKRYFLTLLIIPIILSCSEKVVVNADSVDTITYAFFDSSVPPAYHRSFVIKLTRTNVAIVVDSYGDVLAEDSMAIAVEDFNHVIEVINEANLVSFESRVEDCEGGTSEKLSISVAGEEVYTGNFDHCGGSVIPAKAGAVEDVVQTIISLIPNLQDYLQ